MQEFTIDTGGWKAFWDRWQETINQLPGLKEVMLERLGGRLLPFRRNAQKYYFL